MTIKKDKGNKLVAWFKNKWTGFVEWFEKPWTIKDHLAWFGFWSAFFYVIRYIVGFIRFLKRVKKRKN